jgi:hypothetical protein
MTGPSGGGSGVTGPQGATGVGLSSQIIYNPVSRYSVVDTTGEEVWLVSSSVVYTGLSWDRSGTNMTIYRNSHGHIAGNRVIVRNTNNDYQAALIDTTTANSFSLSTTNTDGTIGSQGAYSLGFTFAHVGSPKTGGTVTAPAGDHTDVQLLTMRLRTGSRSGSTYELVVPASAVNGAGANTGLGNCFIPDFNVRADSDNLGAIGATMATNIGGSYTTFQFASLGSLSRFIILHF